MSSWISRIGILSPLVLALAGGALAPGPAGASAVDIFFDDMENGINGWTTYREIQGEPVFCQEDEWEQVATDSHSPTTSWTNAPYLEAGGADPASVCINHLQSPTIAVPINTTNVELNFWHHYNTEADFDSGVVQVSTDNVNWTSVSPRYHGLSQPGDGVEYIEETLSLEGHYTPGGDLMIRFRFYSDQLISGVGWFVDDVRVSGDIGVPVEETTFGSIKAHYRD